MLSFHLGVEESWPLLFCPALLCFRVAQPDAACEVGGSTPGLSDGDLGILPWGEAEQRILYTSETQKTPWGRPFQSACSGWSVPTKTCGYFEVKISLSLGTTRFSVAWTKAAADPFSSQTFNCEGRGPEEKGKGVVKEAQAGTDTLLNAETLFKEVLAFEGHYQSRDLEDQSQSQCNLLQNS